MIDTRSERLRSIPGMPPVAGSITAGCRFAPRCDRAVDACRTDEPALLPARGGRRLVRCIRPLDDAGAA
jgi:peptide/nickel transport system ATP-binding protein